MKSNCTFLWTELLAFDPDLPDCGVKSYLNKLGFLPDGISLFMWGCDFVHQHDGMAQDRNFPPDVGTYMDMYFEGPKSPHVWSKYRLRDLVKSLKQNNVKVLFSIFPATLQNKFHQEWVTEHPEVQNCLIGELRRDPAAINPLKRLADGSFYEDFLLKKVSEVIADYGFDGWHLCDGYNHPWYQLFQADFSNDMIEQSGLSLPDCCRTLEARGEYIWKHLRREWINFHVQRNTAYLRKMVENIHHQGKMVTCHTVWARDPVDSIYRFGIDLRELDELGFDALTIECVGVAGTMSDHIFRAHYAVPFDNVVQATILTTRACVRKTPLLHMCGVQDDTEGWSTLNYTPSFLEKEIFQYYHLGIWEKGVWRRCFTGRQICLADSETATQWEWLRTHWNLAFADNPVDCDGAVLVWCSEAMDTELEFFAAKRLALTAPVLYRLVAKGANITSVVSVDELDQLRDKPVLAINPGLWPPEAREKLQRYTANKVITAGILAAPSQKTVAGQYYTEQEPLNFFVEHCDHDLTDSEYERLLTELPQSQLRVFNAECNSDAPYYRFSGYRLENGTWRVLVGNVHWQFIYAELVTEKEIENIVPVNKFRGRPFWLEPRPDGKTGSHLYLRVPPLGIAVVDIKFKD